MTKSERLLFMVNLFRVKKRVTMGELAQECEVSERTIYRDLLSLSSLNLPIYYDDGYRLARDVSLPALNFTPDEQELLGYSLRHTELAKSRFLKEKLRNIELKILSALPEKSKDRLSLVLLQRGSNPSGFTLSEDKIIRQFFQALFSNELVKVDLKSPRRRIKEAVAHSIRIKGNNWTLCFTQDSGGGSFCASLRRIIRLKLLGRGEEE